MAPLSDPLLLARLFPIATCVPERASLRTYRPVPDRRAHRLTWTPQPHVARESAICRLAGVPVDDGYLRRASRIVQRVARHAFHGAAGRFDVMAAFVAERFPAATFVADVAGGQGMLSRLLTKRYNIHSEVIDPRGWSLTGVANRQIAYTADLADFYDLIIGLHPDQALRPVVESAARVPVVVVPCCNFWTHGSRHRTSLTRATSDSVSLSELQLPSPPFPRGA